MIVWKKVPFLSLFYTAQADKEEEECELPGCTNRKRRRVEGTGDHDYCCRNHALQDAPYREGI